MACDPNQQITQEDLALFKQNIEAENQHVNSSADTFQKPGGGTGITQTGIENAAAQQRAEIQQLANQAISAVDGVDIGVWTSGVTTYNNYNEYATFDRSGTIERWYLRPSIPLGYTATTTDPINETNFVYPAGLVTEQWVINEVNAGDSQLASGKIWPLSSQESAQVGDMVPPGVLYFRNSATNTAHKLSSTVSGEITAISFTTYTATVGGVDVRLLDVNGGSLALDGIISEGVVINSDITITSDTELQGGLTHNNGIITINSGVKLTVDGFINGRRVKIFNPVDSTALIYTSDIPQYGVNTKYRSVIYPEWFGAIPDGLSPVGNPATPVDEQSTGTDSTDAFQRAVLFAQMGCIKFPQLTKPPKPIIECGYNSAYLINGENAIGDQIHLLDDGVNFRADTWYTFNGNGCTFYWNVPNATASFCGWLNKLHRPEFKNFSLIGTGFNGSFGYCFTWEPSTVFSPSIEGEFSKIKVKGGQLQTANTGWGEGNSFTRIFNISGNIVHDRMTVNQCSFQNFDVLHYSGNQEAVSWSYQECTAIPAVENAIIVFQNNRFSGNLDFTGGDILLKEEGQIIVKARYDDVVLDKSFYGEMYFRARIETIAGKNITLVDATHGTYTFEGFNITAGNASPSSQLVAAKLGIDANVYFRNARIPRQFFVDAATNSEWTEFLTDQPDRAKQIHCYDCETIDGGVNFQITDKTTGSVVDWRNALEGDRHVRPCHFEGFGGKNIVYAMQSYEYDRPNTVSTYGYNNNGFSYINNSVDNSYFLQMPPKSFISEIKINAGAVNPASADRIGIWFANDFIKSIPLSGSARISVDALDDNVGISLPNNFGSSLLQLSLKPMLGGDTLGDIVTGVDVEGFAQVKYQSIDSRFMLPPTDVPTLI